ncbi:MAG: hypothetical protein V3S39_03285 [Thermodesulfobacteriota bacterium]
MKTANLDNLIILRRTKGEPLWRIFILLKEGYPEITGLTRRANRHLFGF